jgi:Fe-S-cluster-containing dehydrogenase component/CRP-like cAMP-binding protein
MSNDVHIIRKQKKREKAFDEHMRLSDVHKLMRIRPFKLMDQSLFPENNSLENILLKDTRIRRLDPGELLVRQGDYGESAFLVLSGSLNSILDIEEESLGRSHITKKSWSQLISQLWQSASMPEVRDTAGYSLTQDLAYASGQRSIFLQDMPGIINKHKNSELESGAIFGYISAMARSPRSASVVANNRAEILEIKWQALRDLMRYSQPFRQHLESAYRDKSLQLHLRNLPIFSGLDDTVIADIARAASFETYGLNNWNVASRQQEKLPEEAIVKQGDYFEGLILIRSGFARVTESLYAGEKTLDYQCRGDVFGLNELFQSNDDTPSSYQQSLYSIGYSDVIRIPLGLLKDKVLPLLSEATINKVRQSNPSNNSKLSNSKFETNSSQITELFVDNLFVNGTKTMLINLDRCTECDDCVTACANAHNGNPRFIRHGPKAGKFMVANACMHCTDPVCMVGCPTGAIHRNAEGGQVVINDQACIGCSTCATSCPYDNIRMVNIISSDGQPVLDETHRPIAKATKCDYCIDQQVAPACEYACPNDALRRIDISETSKIQDWLEE